jgi:hypothetical protein
MKVKCRLQTRFVKKKKKKEFLANIRLWKGKKIKVMLVGHAN